MRIIPGRFFPEICYIPNMGRRKSVLYRIYRNNKCASIYFKVFVFKELHYFWTFKSTLSKLMLILNLGDNLLTILTV